MRAEICHVNLSRSFRGGERQTELLIRELAERGWQQRALVRRNGVLADRLRAVSGLTIVSKPSNVLVASLGIGTPALLHVHQGRSLQVAGLRHLVHHTPYIVTRRVDNPVRANAINRMLYRQAACIVSVSTAVAGVLRELVPELHCEVIPDASAELEHHPETAQRIRQETGKSFLVGHVGALDDAHKGQLQLLEAAAQLAQCDRDVGIMLVGSGRDEAMLRERAADLPNVFFAGQVENVGDYLAAFDLFVFPSRHEGLGSSLLDAYQFGLPVIATRVGGIVDIVTDRENGRLLEVNDIDGLVSAILLYKREPDLASQISRHNKRSAQLYSPASMADRYTKIYEAIAT